MKFRNALLTSAFMMLSGFAAWADTEPDNNTFAGADPLPEIDTVTGMVGVGDSEDWYQIVTTTDGTIQLSLEFTGGVSQFLYFRLYDSNGTTHLTGTGNDYDYGTAGATLHSISQRAAGTYYVKLLMGHTGNYKLSYTVIPPAAGNDAEPNDTPASALTLTEGGSVTGHIKFISNGGTVDAEDFYQLTTTQDGNIALSLEYEGGASNFAYFYLYDSDGTTHLPGAGTDYDYGTAGATIQTISGLAAGTYYVNVDDGNVAGGYTLSASVITDGITNDTEPNGTAATALVIDEGGTVSGHIRYRMNGGINDAEDYYQLTTTEDGTISLSLEYIGGAGNYAYFYLYDSDGTTYLPGAGTDYDYGTPGATIQTIAGLAAGTYYINVDDGNVAGGYILTADVITDGITNDAEPNNTPATALTIPEGGSVSGHIHFRLNGGGYDTDDYYQLTTTQDGTVSLSIEYIGNTGNFTHFYLYDNDGTTYLPGAGINYDYGTEGATIQTIAGLAAGTYYVRVSDANFAGGYVLSASVITDGIANDVEPNDAIATATPIETNSSVEGHIHYRNNGGSYEANDYYSVELSSAGSFTMSLEIASTNGGHFAYFYLYNNVGTFIPGAGTDYDYGTAGATTQTYASLAAGTYYLRVDDGNAATGYTLTNTYCPDAITIVAEGETTFCEGESVTLSTNDHHLSYLWSDGSVTATNTVTLTDDYSLTIDNGGGCVRTSNTISIESTPLPVAIIDADGPLEFCEGGDVTLSVDITPDSYTWSNGETTATITVSETGDYSVELEKNGCTAISDPVHVEVNANPAAMITPDGDTEFCEGGSVTLTSSPAAEYAWSNGESTASIVVNESGDFHVTVTDENGCSATSSVITTTENVNPVAGISADGPTEFCAGESVNLMATGGDSYVWSNGATSASINVTTSGDYFVTVSTAEGCSDISTVISVTVSICEELVIMAEGPVEFCEGGSVTLTSSVEDGNVWNTGATTQSITVSASGDYYTMAGEATSNTITVTVNALPDATIAADGATEFCAGGSVNINAIAGYDNYAWSNGADVSSIAVTESGSYSVTVTNNGCEATSDEVIVTVNTIPAVSISSASTLICYEGSMDLHAASDGATLQWRLDEVDIPGATNATYTATTNGKYTCVASNGICSTVSGTIKLKYAERPETTPSGTASLCGPTLMMSVTPMAGATYQWYQNNSPVAGATSSSYTTSTKGKFYCLIYKDGCTRASRLLTVNDDCRITGEDSDLSLAPNPTAGQFTLAWHAMSGGDVSIQISDMTGKLVFAEAYFIEAGNFTHTYSAENLASGIYIVTLIHSNGFRSDERLVIEK